MKLTLAALALFTTTAFAQINFSNTVDIDPAHTNIKISNVKVVELASKTETVTIPGCRRWGNSSNDCTRVVVLETTPVVQVLVTFKDGTNSGDPDMRTNRVFLNLNPADYSDADLVNLDLETKLVSRSVEIVDVRNSKLCRSLPRYPETRSNCTPVIKYKTIQVAKREVTVVVK